jgi:hypothetical protein
MMNKLFKAKNSTSWDSFEKETMDGIIFPTIKVRDRSLPSCLDILSNRR